jgi:hypothetical protein
MMSLTAHERRRIFLARQRASRETSARLGPPIALAAVLPPRNRHHHLLETALIATLLVATCLGLVSRTLEFHVRTSITDVLPLLEGAADVGADR